MKRCLALFSFLAILTTSIFAQDALCSEKFNSSLNFLNSVRANKLYLTKAVQGKEKILAAAKDFTATVKFDHVLSTAEIERFESLGMSFYRIDGTVARTGSIYPARINWDALNTIAIQAEVERIEASWNPVVLPLLDVSAHEIEADSAWTYTDPMGYPLTGKGMRIADFDTGIDVFHPSFFYADGDTFDWIDTDLSGDFTPGVDAVDLNKNSTAESNELLNFFDGWIYDPAKVWGSGYPSNDGNGYQTYWDWLYNDANGNSQRDFGPDNGYTESDLTYGELLFIALDNNDNGALDVGEKLVALGTSKIYATMNADSVERIRGVDLIYSDPDDYGHGTAVSGILAGGTVGRHIFTGIAPDAEILMGYFFSDIPISYLIPWARSRGADVMLYEFGGFVFHYLDGSSLDEQMITTENATILQVIPSGNLARGDKHAIATVPGLGSITLDITVPTYGGNPILRFYNTTLWRTNESDLTFKLKSPQGGEITLEGNVSGVDGYYVWFDKSTSSRGTCAMDIYVSNNVNSDCVGTWHLTVENNTGSDIEIISNVADHLSSWAGGAEFLNYVSHDRNVTWPATSDSCFSNGSYSTRGFEGYGGVGSGSIPPGEISDFSGRGPRIDGWHLLDICSPGNYDVYSTKSHTDAYNYPLGSYRQFSGTSAAGPHVAAAAALVQQKFPNASMDDVAYLLTSHAATDEFTGEVYNDTWGWGKLRILGAIGVSTDVEDMATGSKTPRLLLGQNYPNPFNPTTWIPFYLPSEGKVKISIYNVKGELVRVLRDRTMDAGAHSVIWDGTDLKGKLAASGLYFCIMKFKGSVQSRKLVLIR